MADFADPENWNSNDSCEVFMIRALLEVYSDYLIISSSQTTATGLSKVLDSQTSHDKITRFFVAEGFDLQRLMEACKTHGSPMRV